MASNDPNTAQQLTDAAARILNETAMNTHFERVRTYAAFAENGDMLEQIRRANEANTQLQAALAQSQEDATYWRRTAELNVKTNESKQKMITELQASLAESHNHLDTTLRAAETLKELANSRKETIDSKSTVEHLLGTQIEHFKMRLANTEAAAMQIDSQRLDLDAELRAAEQRKSDAHERYTTLL